MRTTINLPDDVITVARVLSEQRAITLGEAVAVLVRRGASAGGTAEQTPPDTRAFPIRHRTNTNHVITDELVAKYRDDD